MNKHNLIFTETDDVLKVEWSDRAPDDDDRYSDDSLFLYAQVPKEEGHRALMTKFINTWDKWMKETRG